MVNPPTNSSRDIKKLLEENQQLLRAIYRQSEKTRRYIFWGRVITTIYLLLFISAAILAAVTLPPLVKGVVGPYRELLGSSKSKADINQGLLEQVQSLLNSN